MTPTTTSPAASRPPVAPRHEARHRGPRRPEAGRRGPSFGEPAPWAGRERPVGRGPVGTPPTAPPVDPAAEADRVLAALRGAHEQLERTRRTLEAFVQDISRVPAPRRTVVPLPTRADVAAAPPVVAPPVAAVPAAGTGAGARATTPGAPDADETPAADAAPGRDTPPPALAGHVLRPTRPEGAVVHGAPGSDATGDAASPATDGRPAGVPTAAGADDGARRARATVGRAARRARGQRTAWTTGGERFSDELLGRRRMAPSPREGSAVARPLDASSGLLGRRRTAA